VPDATFGSDAEYTVFGLCITPMSSQIDHTITKNAKLHHVTVIAMLRFVAAILSIFFGMAVDVHRASNFGPWSKV
jgi:hypothetical protein